MATRQQQEEIVVSEQTRAFAQWWIHRLERAAKTHGMSWYQVHALETSLGEVLFEWWGYKGKKKKLSLFVEKEEVTYLRMWDYDEGGRGGCMEEGECTWLDHALLLWSWFLS